MGSLDLVPRKTFVIWSISEQLDIYYVFDQTAKPLNTEIYNLAADVR